MKKIVIQWDGEHVPEALKGAPPGRYVLQALAGEAPLTDEEDLGLRRALDQLDAGQGRSLADVVREIRGRKPRP
jgi:hypothetical protein